jgi:hypothetical protein
MAESKNSITTPGEINIKRFELRSANGKLFDLSAVAVDLTIYEDIFSNTMSGSLIIQDSLDLINSLPIMGEEILYIDLQTPSLEKSITNEFYVYKLTGLSQKKRASTYILHFCSLELISSINSKISKSFKGNITDTVKNIFADKRYLASGKKIIFDTTANDYRFIAPYWSPLQTINWLTTKSLNKNGVSNFLFYENNKEFMYVSVDSLLSDKPVRDYVLSDVNSTTAVGGDIDKRYSFVELVDMPVTFDYMRNMSAGMYGGVLYTYDMTTKKIKKTTYDYLDDFSKSAHTNKIPLKSKNFFNNRGSNVQFAEKNDYLTGVSKSQKIHETMLQRSSLLEQMRAFKFNIKVFGRTDIKVGQTITYTAPKQREIAKDEIQADPNSEYFTGKYLITAIRHQIIAGQHHMEMEIVSDSFVKDISV